MQIKSWIKGNRVDSFDKDRIYVVEFWATWCGPCKQSIPHLTELAKKNSDVTFVGVSIWEDDKDGNIAKFVSEMGDKMDYNVAYSGNQDGMAQTWMAAAGQNGIPSAFVIKGGQIQWIGHPMELEQPLAEIKSGKFNMAAFKAKFDKAAEANRQQMAAQAELRACAKLFDDGKRAEAHAQLDALVKKYPAMKQSAESIKFGWMAKEDPKQWEKLAATYAASKDQMKIQQLSSFGLGQAQSPNGNAELGRKAIELALKGTAEKDFLVLWYAANFYKEVKDFRAALDITNKLLAVYPTSEYKDNADLKAALDKQKKDLETKVSG